MRGVGRGQGERSGGGESGREEWGGERVRGVGESGREEEREKRGTRGREREGDKGEREGREGK